MPVPTYPPSILTPSGIARQPHNGSPSHVDLVAKHRELFWDEFTHHPPTSRSLCVQQPQHDFPATIARGSSAHLTNKHPRLRSFPRPENPASESLELLQPTAMAQGQVKKSAKPAAKKWVKLHSNQSNLSFNLISSLQWIPEY